MDKQTYQDRKEKYLGWIKQLAGSQGFYCRLLEQLNEDENAMNTLLEQDFRTCVDMILWLEE